MSRFGHPEFEVINIHHVLGARFCDNWGIVSTPVNLPQPEALAPLAWPIIGVQCQLPLQAYTLIWGLGQQGRLEAGGEGWIDSPSHSIHPLLQ